MVSPTDRRGGPPEYRPQPAWGPPPGHRPPQYAPGPAGHAAPGPAGPVAGGPAYAAPHPAGGSAHAAPHHPAGAPPYAQPHPAVAPAPSGSRVALRVLGALLVVVALVAAFLAGRLTAPGGDAAAPVAAPTATTAAPEQLSPPSGAVYGYYPRDMTFEWTAVPDAVSYTVDVEALDTSNGNWMDVSEGRMGGITGTSTLYSFVGAQPGRWRVTAVDADGRAGTPSAWSGFRFTQ